MKTIFIKQIRVNNFGGIAQAEYNFDKSFNTLEGGFGDGKTTAFNAFKWSLGFSSSKWEPMILANRIYKISTEVESIVLVDGEEHSFKKASISNYKIKKSDDGIEKEIYAGNKLEYYIDAKKLDATPFREEVAQIFGQDYFTLELLIDYNLFNNSDGTRWDKESRRNFLFKLFDIENKIKKLNNKEEFASIKKYLDEGKKEFEIKQILNTMKTTIQNALEKNEILYNDTTSEINKYSLIDFKELEKTKDKLSKELDQLMENKENSLDMALKLKMEERANLNAKLTLIENEYLQKCKQQQSKIFSLKNELDILKNKKYFIEERLNRFDIDIEDLERDIKLAKEETFNEDDKLCPTCKRELPENSINELILKFEQNKELKIHNLEKSIFDKKNNNKIDLEAQTNIEKEICNKEEELNKVELEKIEKEDTLELENKIKNINEEIIKIQQEDTSNVKDKLIIEIKSKYEDVLKELGKQKYLEDLNNKLEKLNNENAILMQQETERVIKKETLNKYLQEQIKLVDEEINTHFEKVKYNFYYWNSSSTENETRDVCNVALKDSGVEYDAMSSGQKVLADYYTNVSLRKILGVNLPQFVDETICLGEENILNLLEKQDWQQIYLITKNTPNFKALKISDRYSLKDCEIRQK